jgi:hypothetical protein
MIGPARSMKFVENKSARTHRAPFKQIKDKTATLGEQRQENTIPAANSGE